MACNPAEAGWGLRAYGSSGGSYGSSGYSSHGSSGHSSYGSSGYAAYRSHGSSGGGLFARIKAHFAAKRAAWASHGSSGYSSYGSSGYSSYGSSGYTTYRSHGSSGAASYGSSGAVSYGSAGSSGHVSYHSYSQATPAVSGGVSVSHASPVVRSSARQVQPTYAARSYATEVQEPLTQASSASASRSTASAQVADDAALITVAVPAAARVTVNGHPTTSDGPIRQFLSRGLKNGYTYTYLVAVETEVDGRSSTETKSIRVRAGDAQRLVFSEPQANEVETAVTVHVPEDATVQLAGNPTAAKGATRVFRTRQLSAGESWDNYEIKVTVVRDGRALSKRQSLRLSAGDTKELTFDFDGEVSEASLARR